MKILARYTSQKYVIFLFLVIVAHSKPCIVDKCQTCPNNSTVHCSLCETGWYLRNFTGGDKPYNECWSLAKLWITIFAIALLSLLLCGLCYYCYMVGKKWRVNKMAKSQNYRFDPNQGSPRQGQMMTEPAMPIQQPVASPPIMTPVQPISPNYSPPRPVQEIPVQPVYQPRVPVQPQQPQVIRSPGRVRPSNVQPRRVVRPSGRVRQAGGGGAQRRSYVSPQRSPTVRRQGEGAPRRVVRR